VQEDKASLLFAQESLALYRQLEDKKGIAWALHLRGNCALYIERDYEQAAFLLEQSLALAEKLDDKALMPWLYHSLGWIAMYRSDYPSVTKQGERGVTLARETGNQRALALLFYLLGKAAARQHEYARAEALLLDALALCRGLKSELNVFHLLNQLGEVTRIQKAYERAAMYYQECLAFAPRIKGYQGAFSIPLFNLGLVAIRQGDPQRATDLFRESHGRAGYENTGFALWKLWGFGLVAAAQGRARRAARLYAAVEQLLEIVNWEADYTEDREDYAQDVGLVRDQLGEAELAAAWAEGRAMSLEQAVAFALEEDDDQ
jgi:tetratricopeptide (TPR) repeat protein